MMTIAGLSHIFKWENLHNWWLTKYFFAPLYMPVSMVGSIAVLSSEILSVILLKPFLQWKRSLLR